MKRLLSLPLFLLLFALCGCRAQTAASAVDFLCDTVVTIRAYAPQEAVDSAMRLAGDYERVLSKTIENSDVWKINHAEGQPVEVNPETADLIRLSIETAAYSGGAFDVTIAPLSAMWDFTADAPSLPDPDALLETATRVDYRNIRLEGNTVTLLNGAQIDLGGIAKGYIADRVADYLKERGVKHACINMGGNVLVFGGKPDGTPWTIGVRDPNGTPDQSEEILKLNDGAAVTSGNYERCFDLDGVRYHHILDPKTGMPIQNGVVSVTIQTARSAIADALSTACFVLGPEHSSEILTHYGASAIFLCSDGTRIALP